MMGILGHAASLVLSVTGWGGGGAGVLQVQLGWVCVPWGALLCFMQCRLPSRCSALFPGAGCTHVAGLRTAFNTFSNLPNDRFSGALRSQWKVKRVWTSTEKYLSSSATYSRVMCWPRQSGSHSQNSKIPSLAYFFFFIFFWVFLPLGWGVQARAHALQHLFCQKASIVLEKKKKKASGDS